MRAMMRAALTCGLTLATSACFLPVPYTEPASPVVVGRLVRSDGAPAAGARVAVTGESRDGGCKRMLVGAVTDSAGDFRLPATTVRRRGILLFPAFERFTNPWWLCVGTGDSALNEVYAGVVPLRTRNAVADSLTCLEWAWQGEMRVTCRIPEDDATVQSFGRWTDAGATGYYRLIFVPIGWNARAPAPGVFVQWVERGTGDAPERVRETVSLPLAPQPLTIDAPSLQRTRDGSTCVRVKSTGRATSWRSLHQPREDAALVLGPPGQVRRVASCARAD